MRIHMHIESVMLFQNAEKVDPFGDKTLRNVDSQVLDPDIVNRSEAMYEL
jgi:hypothetical protein